MLTIIIESESGDKNNLTCKANNQIHKKGSAKQQICKKGVSDANSLGTYAQHYPFSARCQAGKL